jgi:hypothetical protein
VVTVNGAVVRSGWVRFAAGVAAGVILGAWAGLAGDGLRGPAGRSEARAAGGSAIQIDVLHRAPVLLTSPGPVELRFEVVCAISDPAAQSCAPSGELYVAGAGDTRYARFPMVLEERGFRVLRATVPERYTRAGSFSYYAVIREAVGGAERTFPPGGEGAPLQVWVVKDPVTVALGEHGFGTTRAPDEVAVRLGWGAALDEVGLDAGPGRATVGPASFDIAPDGSVVILDQVNGRLVTYERGGAEARGTVPMDVAGWTADLAIGADGTLYVLDNGGVSDAGPIVHALGAGGVPLGSTALLERNGDMIRMGPEGPVVHVMPSDTWVPVAVGRSLLSPAMQAAGAQPGLPIGAGEQVVVSASFDEARLAIVRGSEVVRVWRVTSRTDLGEVQLAEPLGKGLLVVLRVWTEKEAEFLVLHLGSEGLLSSFAVEAAEWAEMSALSRFRLAPGGLYQMRADPEGIEVVRYDVER